jgi:hypothetical protein
MFWRTMSSPHVNIKKGHVLFFGQLSGQYTLARALLREASCPRLRVAHTELLCMSMLESTDFFHCTSNRLQPHQSSISHTKAALTCPPWYPPLAWCPPLWAPV